MHLEMFAHIEFKVLDFAKSKHFYQKALEPLGILLICEDPNEKIAGYGKQNRVELLIQGEIS